MTVEIDAQTAGIIDALDRILKQMIRTPKFKETLIVLLKSIDPPAVRGLVRTIFWEDAGLLLSVLGALPSIVNALFEAVAEAASQIQSMPPPLLQDLLSRIVGGIDGAALGSAAGGLASAAGALQAGDGKYLSESVRSLREEAVGSFREAAGIAELTERLEKWMGEVASRAQEETTKTRALLDAFGEALEKNPEFVERVMRPLVSPLLDSGQD